MAGDSRLNGVRSALSVVSARTLCLVGSLSDTAAPIPGSAWTVREAAVHLAMLGFRHAGMVHGEPTQYPSLAPDAWARLNDQLNADIPETDPGKLADLMGEGTECLLAATVTCDDRRAVLYHGGTVITIPDLLGITVAEHLLHGYDMAAATGRPWPIDPHHAALGVLGHGPGYGRWVNPATTATHTAAYAVELTTGEQFTIRFVEGACRHRPRDAGPVDCTITADPGAFLLVGWGRMSKWAAIATGLFRTGGVRPELGLGFPDLFLFP